MLLACHAVKINYVMYTYLLACSAAQTSYGCIPLLLTSYTVQTTYGFILIYWHAMPSKPNNVVFALCLACNAVLFDSLLYFYMWHYIGYMSSGVK